MKQSLELQRKELNDCRAEITALKMHIEGSRSGWNLATTDVDNAQSESLEKYKEEIKSLKMQIESIKSMNTTALDSVVSLVPEKESVNLDVKVVEIHEDKNVISQPVNAVMRALDARDTQWPGTHSLDDSLDRPFDLSRGLLVVPNDGDSLENIQSVPKQGDELLIADVGQSKSENVSVEAVSEKMASSFYLISDIELETPVT